MQDSWRTKRKKLFTYIIIFFIAIFVAYKAYPYIFPAPTCFDKKQNADEEGIDCGGSCGNICTASILPLEVKFARYTESEDGVYDLVAMVENKNINKNTQGSLADYTFTVYDKAGQIVKVINGSTNIPIGQTFPIIVQNTRLNLKSSGNSISKINFNIVDGGRIWKKVDELYKNVFFSISNTEFIENKNNTTQVIATIKNNTRAYFRDVPVRVLLFDESDNIVGANETLIKEINAKEVKNISFMWRIPLTIKNPKIEIYPIVTPDTYFK